MINSYAILSPYHDGPVAEVRVSGDTAQVLNDSSKGMIARKVQNSADRLRALLGGSSHMYLHDGRPVEFRSYALCSGEHVEVSQDGMTVMINGKILSDADRKSIYDSLGSNQLRVAIENSPERAAVRDMRIAQLLPLVPAGGISVDDLKQNHPNLCRFPEVQEILAGIAPGMVLFPEDLSNYLSRFPRA